VLRQDCMELAQQGWGIPTLKTRNYGMPAGPAQYKPMVLNVFAEGRQIHLQFCERVTLKKILTQVNSHVLFYCRTKSVTQNIRGFTHWHSQGGHSPQLLEHIVVLCFERRYPKQNSVNSLALQFFGPSQIFGLVTLLVLLKDYWEPHKRCLGAACDFQKSGFWFASGAAFEVSVASCFNRWLLRPVRWWWNCFLSDPTCRTIFRRC